MHLFLMALAVIWLFRIAARQRRLLHPRPRRPFNWHLALFLAGLLGAIVGLAQVSQWLSTAPSERASADPDAWAEMYSDWALRDVHLVPLN